MGVCSRVNFTISCVLSRAGYSSGHLLWYWFWRWLWHLLRLWFLLTWKDSPDRGDRYFTFYNSEVTHVLLFLSACPDWLAVNIVLLKTVRKAAKEF